MVGEIQQQLQSDPRLAESDRVADHHAVVLGQNAAGPLDRITLELRQIERVQIGRHAAGRFQISPEELEQRLQVHLIGRVFRLPNLDVSNRPINSCLKSRDWSHCPSNQSARSQIAPAP